MKQLTTIPVALAAAGVLMFNQLHAAVPGGEIDFGKFAPSASGGQFVEVNINSNLISMVSRLAEKAEPQVAELLRGLQQIRVNVVGLGDDNRADVEQRIKTIRTDLDGKGWERIVTAQQEGQDVGVHLKTRDAEAIEGLVITVLQGKREAVLINIVGDIRPEKVSILGERFNIAPLKQLGAPLAKQ